MLAEYYKKIIRRKVQTDIFNCGLCYYTNYGSGFSYFELEEYKKIAKELGYNCDFHRNFTIDIYP